MLLCSTSATNTAQVTHSVSDNHYVIHECYYVAHQQPTLHNLLTVSVTIIMSFMNVIM